MLASIMRLIPNNMLWRESEVTLLRVLIDYQFTLTKMHIHVSCIYLPLAMTFIPTWLEASPCAGILSKNEQKTMMLHIDKELFANDPNWNSVSHFDLVVLVRGENSNPSGGGKQEQVIHIFGKVCI